jgi:hypothetical protein
MIPSNTVTNSFSEISAIVDAVMLKLVAAETSFGATQIHFRFYLASADSTSAAK